MPHIVVLGCGSSLRTDDRFGLEVAGRLADLFHDQPGVTVLAAAQLLPEHAALLRDARLVLVLDAARITPGEIRVRRVKPSLHGNQPSLTHTLTPEDLLHLTSQLYGPQPRMYLLTAGAYSFDIGDVMSPAMSALADRTVAEVTTRLRRLLSS